MSSVSGAPVLRRVRAYGSWDDVLGLEERVDQALRRVPVPSVVTATVPAIVTAGDATVYALVSGSGVLTISARRAGQTLTVKSVTGTLTVRDDSGSTIEGASSLSLAALAVGRLLWTGSRWVTL